MTSDRENKVIIHAMLEAKNLSKKGDSDLHHPTGRWFSAKDL